MRYFNTSVRSCDAIKKRKERALAEPMLISWSVQECNYGKKKKKSLSSISDVKLEIFQVGSISIVHVNT